MESLQDLAVLQDLGLDSEDPPRENDWLDTRGTWPVYHRGMFAKVLEWQSRDISLVEARALVRGTHSLGAATAT